MATTSIYCSKCRDNSAHGIARGKLSSDRFRQVSVVERNGNGSYRCECECGHTWSSKSEEAERLFNQRRG